MRKLLTIPLCLLALTACMCGSLNGGGSGTNTGNGIIVGKIVAHSEESVEGVGITLRPNGYLQAPPWNIGLTAKSDIRETVTGPDGSFTIDSLPSGTYSVEANDHHGNAVLLKCSVTQDGPATTLDEAVLEPYAAITGTVAVAPSGVRQYVQIYGLERCVAADSTGDYTIGNLPAGVFTLRIVCPDTLITPVTIPAQQAFPGAITNAPPAGWLFSKKIHLNTTAGGADVAGNVTDFPVLVRLNNNTFDFNQSGADGADLRFVKSDGSPLPFEIERWDAGVRKGEIWVRLDTIYGNDSTQSITMYWGNPNASGNSNGATVFDTASDFAAVWHLNENSDSVHDATVGAFNGTTSGCITATGIIGNARSFANGDYIKIAGLLNSPANVTLSAWVLSDTSNWGQSNNWGQDIITIGDYALIRLEDVFGIGTSGWYQNQPIGPGPDTSFVMVNSGRFLANTGWHFISFSINTTTHVQVLYIDGVQSAIANDGNPICYSGLGSDTYIGIHGNDEKIYNFTGRIDEVRVNRIALSADWIKLCFMNQKEQDALVKW